MSVSRNETILYFSQDGTLTGVRVKGLDPVQWDGIGKIVNLQNKDAPILERQVDQYTNHLHPVVRKCLAKKTKSASFSLELLYALKEEEGLVINGDAQNTHIRIYAAQKYGNNDDLVNVDQLIKTIRQKNKTYVEMEEINKDVQRIISRFQKSDLTPVKKDILNNFMVFYAQQKDKIFSRSQIVEDWINQSIQENQINPLEPLHRHRRTDCFSIFNAKNLFKNPKDLKDTDSIQFFKKFMQGETLSEDLQALFEFPLKEAEVENGVYYQPNPQNF